MHIIHKYFPGLSEKQTKQFADLQSLYQNWNAQINVISRKDIDKLYTNHILHSLAIAKVSNFKKGTKILDIGTGGGFPGIPLAILFPEVEFFNFEAFWYNEKAPWATHLFLLRIHLSITSRTSHYV